MFPDIFYPISTRQQKAIAALVEDYQERMKLNISAALLVKEEVDRREFLLYANTYQNVINDLKGLL